MSLNEDMSAAERDFFASRGRNTDALLAENKDGIQRASDETPVQQAPVAEADQKERNPVHSQAPDGVVPPSPSGAPDTKSAPAPFEDDEPTDPQLGHPKRVSWNKYKTSEDSRKELEKQIEEFRNEQIEAAKREAAFNERFRLFNEALKDDPQQQVEEDPQPDPMQDAYAYMQWQDRQREKLAAELHEYRQQQGQLTEEQQFKNLYSQSMASAATQYPILAPAYHYLIKHRADELEISRPDLSPEQRQQWLQQEEAALARRELSQGRNPASLVYQLAKSRGFENWYAQQQNNQSPAPAGGGGVGANGTLGTTSPPGAQAAPAPSNPEIPTAVQQVQAIAANQNAARSLSNGGGAPLQNIDARSLANMTDDEFAAVFSRLQNSRDKARLRELMGG